MGEELTRRSFLIGAGAAVAAAAVAPAAGLTLDGVPIVFDDPAQKLAALINDNLYGDLVDVTRRAFQPCWYVELYRSNPLLENLAWAARATPPTTPGSSRRPTTSSTMHASSSSRRVRTVGMQAARRARNL